VAKNDEVHLALSSALASGEIERNYIAIVRGDIQDARGTIDAPLGRNPVNRMRRAVRRGGRRAVTKFAVLERFGDYTLVGIELETGRMHQIRVHMSHIGRPVAGDSAYGEFLVSWALGGRLFTPRVLSLRIREQGRE